MPKLHVHGINLYYEMVGQGQPLLFIHGLGDSARTWEKQLPLFSKQYQVVTFDVRGHGQSDKPPGPYTISLFAEDTAELIKSLGIAPAHVVGISMGGMIAFQLAATMPDFLKSMVIINSGPAMLVCTLKERWEIFKRLALVRILGMRAIGKVLSQRIFPKPEHEALRKIFVERWAENDKRAYLDSTRALVNWSVAEHLGAIRCPTLVIASDGDYTPVSAKEAYVAKMPHADLVVMSDSHHGVHLEWPEKFNEILITFLSKQA